MYRWLVCNIRDVLCVLRIFVMRATIIESLHADCKWWTACSHALPSEKELSQTQHLEAFSLASAYAPWLQRWRLNLCWLSVLIRHPLRHVDEGRCTRCDDYTNYKAQQIWGIRWCEHILSSFPVWSKVHCFARIHCRPGAIECRHLMQLRSTSKSSIPCAPLAFFVCTCAFLIAFIVFSMRAQSP